MPQVIFTFLLLSFFFKDVLNNSDHQAVLYLGNLVEGKYSFTLTVTDTKGQSSTSRGSVEVKAGTWTDTSSRLTDTRPILSPLPLAFRQPRRTECSNRDRLHDQRQKDVRVHACVFCGSVCGIVRRDPNTARGWSLSRLSGLFPRIQRVDDPARQPAH